MRNIRKFTVVMSVYKNDKEEFLKEAINSLLNQTLLPNEIVIVIDGWVSEGILELLKGYQKANRTEIVIIKLEENKGLANALNVGIKRAKNDIIARMDADDICFKDRFEKQIPYFFEKGLDVLGGQIVEFGKNKEDVLSEKTLPLKHNQIVKLLKKRNSFTHPTVIFKKEVFQILKGYDIKAFPEDYDFFVRASLGGFIFGNLSDKVLWFRLGEDQSGTIRRRWGKQYAKKEYKLYKKFYRIGFYSYTECLIMLLTRIPLRLLPFPIFKFIFLKIARKS